MIRIHMHDGPPVDTIRHTFEQAMSAWEANVGIEVGGPKESLDWAVKDPGDWLHPERTIKPNEIKSIERGEW